MKKKVLSKKEPDLKIWKILRLPVLWKKKEKMCSGKNTKDVAG